MNRKPHSGHRILRLGTRASNLALAQSRLIARLLEKRHPGLSVELVEIRTTGDQVLDKPLKSFGGAGVFVKELENALLGQRIDLAVHSLKDVPTRQPRGLVIAAIAGREDPRDVAVTKGGARLENLPPGSLIGSGSLRRRAQLKARFPHLQFAEIRGNVETRIRKVLDGNYSGTILARAGLKRLGLLKQASQVLPLTWMLPAPGQGALGIECRTADRRTRQLLAVLHDEDVAACVTAERSLLEALGSGCHLPLGALGTLEAGGRRLRLRAAFGLPDGSLMVREEMMLPPARAQALGRKLGKLIFARGGRDILKRLTDE